MDRRQQPRLGGLARPSSAIRRRRVARRVRRAVPPGTAWLDAGMRPASGSAAIGPHLVLLAVALLAAATFVPAAAAAPRGARRVLRNSLLQTTFPASWQARIGHLRIGGRPVAEYSLSSTSAPLDADAIPVTGAVGITIYLYPESLVTRGVALSGDLGLAAAQLIDLGVVGIPHDAHYVTNVGALRPASLGDLPAARIAYLYEYRDDYNLNLQDDVVALHGHTIVQVELDTAPALRPHAEPVFGALLRAWRWRSGRATMAR